MEDLPLDFNSKDLGKLASMEYLPPTCSSKDLSKLASMHGRPASYLQLQGPR
jgi:hypothetical protein